MTAKINGPTGTRQTEKTQKNKKSSGADKAKFGSLLDSLMEVESPEQVDAVQATGQEGGKRSYVPQDATERSAWMLDKLEQLYADILTGKPTAAAEELRQALETAVENKEQLPEHLLQLVNEIDVRSAVEIAKLEASSQNRS